MAENERQQRMAERILEDERLRGDLEDDAATPLINWASERAAAAASDPARPDDAVEAEVAAVRQATRTAARSGETEPAKLIALAEQTLANSAPAPVAAAAAPAAPPSTTAVPAPVEAKQSGAAASAIAAAATASAGQQAETQDAPPPAAVPAKSAAPLSPAVAPSAQTESRAKPPAATPAAPVASTEQRPAGAGDPSRRKRRRLSRFIKHILGGD